MSRAESVKTEASPARWRMAKAEVRLISPLVGEMSGRTEGGAVPLAYQVLTGASSEKIHFEACRSQTSRSFAPPSALPGISPTRGEIGQSPIDSAFPPRHISPVNVLRAG